MRTYKHLRQRLLQRLNPASEVVMYGVLLTATAENDITKDNGTRNDTRTARRNTRIRATTPTGSGVSYSIGSNADGRVTTGGSMRTECEPNT